MSIGTVLARNSVQSCYAPKGCTIRNDIGVLGEGIKTIKLRKERQIIRFDAQTLEITEIINPKNEKENDPVYKKLKEAGLLDEDKMRQKEIPCDESLLNAMRRHYEELFALKRARETVIKIEEDQLEELFEHTESKSDADELSAEGVTENSSVRLDPEAGVASDSDDSDNCDNESEAGPQ